MQSSLSLHGIIERPQSRDIFILHEKFIQGVGHEQHVRIRLLGESFKKIFLKDAAQFEYFAPEKRFYAYDINAELGDIDILEEFGGIASGQERLSMKLSDLFCFLSSRKVGPGLLRTDSHCESPCWNLCYIAALDGNTYQVGAIWDNAGWLIEAEADEAKVEGKYGPARASSARMSFFRITIEPGLRK